MSGRPVSPNQSDYVDIKMTLTVRQARCFLAAWRLLSSVVVGKLQVTAPPEEWPMLAAIYADTDLEPPEIHDLQEKLLPVIRYLWP